MTIPILSFIRLLQIYFNYAAYAKARPREEKNALMHINIRFFSSQTIMREKKK